MYLHVPMNEDNEKTTKPILRQQANWEGLYFYQKAVVLYQLTFDNTKDSSANGQTRKWQISP